MTRIHVSSDYVTGKTTEIPFTAAEEAAADAAELQAPAVMAAGDLALINAMLVDPGNPLRALALLVLQEINTLRASVTALNVKAGIAQTLPPYTAAQLVAALQSKIR